MSEPQTVEELIERYDTDPLFYAIVNQVDPGGWTDDDGVRHRGLSVFSARRALEIMSVVQPVVDELEARLAKSDKEVWRLVEVNTHLREYWTTRNADERRRNLLRST